MFGVGKGSVTPRLPRRQTRYLAVHVGYPDVMAQSLALNVLAGRSHD